MINSIHRASTFRYAENSFWQNFRPSSRKWNVLSNRGEGIVRIVGEGVLCGLPNPDPILDQKMLFLHQFSDLGYLPFTWEMRKFWMGNQMVFTHEITNNPTNVPMIFKGTLTLASEVHSYNTRFVSTHNSHRPRIRNNYGVYLIFRDYMAMLKNFYPQSRFLTPIPSHQLQVSPLLQSRPVSPLLQSRPASPLLQSRTASPLSFRKEQPRPNQQKWPMVSAEAESFGLQRKLKFYWKSRAQNMQKLKVYPPRRREKYGNRFLMSLKLPAGRRIYHKSSRSPWNNLKN